MSARIAPEPVSIAVSPAAQFTPRQSQPTRPIESAGATSTDLNRDRAFGRQLSDGNKARPGERPPGKDPSVTPQALFDASLIAAEFKPNVEFKDNDKSDNSSKAETNTAKATEQIATREVSQTATTPNDQFAAKAEAPEQNIQSNVQSEKSDIQSEKTAFALIA